MDPNNFYCYYLNIIYTDDIEGKYRKHYKQGVFQKAYINKRLHYEDQSKEQTEQKE